MIKHIKTNHSNWLPDYIATTAQQIDFNHLKQIGVKTVMFDLDHTILVHGTVDIDQRTAKTLISSGLDLYIATNRRYSPQLDDIAKQIKARGIIHSASELRMRKPSGQYYLAATKKIGLKPNQIAMVGDRLLQDVWGANRAGINTIMVNKFGKIYWFDQALTIIDRLVPALFSSSYKDIK